MTTEAPWRVETLDIDLGVASASVAMNAGPRILSYSTPNGVDFLASLPDLAIQDAPDGPYRFLGGHRLWRAPEVPSITYQRDDTAVAISQQDHGVELSGAADRDGVTKRVSIRQSDEYTYIRHTLVNEGSRPIRTAPWAITQMALGGIAVLPLADEPTDSYALQPNRNLVLWPYTDLCAPEFGFDPGRITVEGTTRESVAKIGQPNRRGWIAYVLGSQVFVKWAKIHDDDAAYADLGASSQCYRNEHFVELETLGPLVDLQPGQEATHVEAWSIVELADRSLDETLESLPTHPGGQPM